MTRAAGNEAHVRANWLALVAPFGAWGLHAAVSTVVTISACGGQHQSLIRAVVLGGGACALGVAVASALTARAALLRSADAPGVFTLEGRNVGQFVAQLALLCSLVFGLAVLWSMLPGVLVSRVCEVGR